MSIQKKVLAVIMGGGRGTRLHPLTMERCKPAVPLAGKYRLVDIPISNCINSDINRIFLLTQFNTASLHRHIQGTYHFDPFGGGFVDILSAEQTEKSADWYQGTADAVRRNLIHFRMYDHDLVLILSGDQLYKMDFREVIEAHIKGGADVTIAALPVPVSKVEGLGLMKVSDDLSIAEFAEKPKDPAVIAGLALSEKLEKRLQSASDEKHCLASMGIYVFNRKVLAEALDNTMTDFGKEVIPSLLGRKKLFAHIFDIDIGRAHHLGFGAGGLQLFALTQIGSKGYNLTAVFRLQPFENDRGIKSAGIGENNFFRDKHGRLLW